MEEILHQFVDSLSHYLQGRLNPRWLAGFLKPSTVLGWVPSPAVYEKILPQFIQDGDASSRGISGWNWKWMM